MTQEYIQLAFDRIIQTHVYTAIVLRNKEQRFAIFTEPSVGKFLQSHLSGEERPRLLSHDLLSTILNALDVKVKQVLIRDVQDTTFFSHIFLETEKNGLQHIIEIDARPSDCIILAFLHNAPVLCTKELTEKVIPFVE